MNRKPNWERQCGGRCPQVTRDRGREDDGEDTGQPKFRDMNETVGGPKQIFTGGVNSHFNMELVGGGFI